MAKKEKETKETTKETRYRKKRGGVLYTIVAVILIAASVVAACTVFFQVETVTVEGNERYTQEEILSVASVEMGASFIMHCNTRILFASFSSLMLFRFASCRASVIVEPSFRLYYSSGFLFCKVFFQNIFKKTLKRSRALCIIGA